MRDRLIAVTLAAGMILGVLGGCASKEDGKVKLDPAKPVTIDIWHYYNGAQKSAFDQLVGEFNNTVGAEKGIAVEAFNQGNVNQLAESVLASANEKVGTEPVPNIFTAYADTAYQIDKMGLVANLEGYLTPDEIAAYVPSYIEEGRLGKNGELKIFPTAKSTEIFMLNQTDWAPFAAESGAVLEELSTMEGVAKASAQYYEWTDAKTPDVPEDGKAFFGRDAMANYFIIGCRQLGAEIFAVKDGVVTFNIDPGIMRRLWDCYYVPFINGYFAANGRFRSDDARVGDLLALVGSTSSATYFPTGVTNENGEEHPIEALVLPAPHFEGGEAYAVQQGAGMVVTKASPQEEYASVEFLKWFTTPKRNLSFSILSGYLPVMTGANTYEHLFKAMSEMPELEFSELLKKTLETAFNTAQEETLYTNQAFEGGTEARTVLEKSLSDKAVADRKQVESLIATGIGREEAAARFDTQENFDSWLEGLKEDLAKTQKGTP